MARNLAIVALALLLALALWFWRGTQAPEPVAAPAEQGQQCDMPLSRPTADLSAAPRQAVAAPEPAGPPAIARLVVICRAKETGAPLAGQTVYVYGEQKSGPVPAGEIVETGADGRVEREVAPGKPLHVDVYPKKRGANASARREIEALAAGEHREVIVELGTQEDAHFFARVLSRETHAPIAGAEIQGGPSPLATDADGRFDVANSSWSMQRLSILAAGYAETVVVAQPGHETPEKALPIELERSCTLVGLLQGAGDAAKRGRLRMVVTTEGYRLTTQDHSELGSIAAEYDHTWRAEFDASGRAEIVGLVPNAPLRVSVHAGATRLLELTDPISIPPGATRELELKAADTCKLTGIVRDGAGAVVPGVTLWLLRTGTSPRLHLESYEGEDRVGDAKTDEQGRFTFPKVSPGTWRLGPEAKMYRDGAPIPADAAAPFATLVEIPAGEAEHQVDLVVHRGLTITGKALDPDDKPVNNAGIGARTGGTWLGTSCGEDGTFVLGPLVPGTYTLDASPSFHKELADSVDVQAEAGARDVVLRLQRAGTLSGRVIDAGTGEGVAATIAFSQPGGKSIPFARSKANGSFELGSLLPGSYALAATLPDGRTGILRGVDLAAGSRLTDLVISVRAGAKLRVRYAGEQKFASLSIKQDGVYFTGDGIEKGTSKSFSAPAGIVRVVCRLGDTHKEFVRELTLKGGDELELVFTDED